MTCNVMTCLCGPLFAIFPRSEVVLTLMRPRAEAATPYPQSITGLATSVDKFFTYYSWWTLDGF